MARVLPLAAKAALSAGSNNATTVGNATVVRVVATAGVVVVFRTDSDDNVIGSFTQLNNSVELVEKNASDKIYVTGAAVEVAKVGYTA
jgi:hypothetical protein|tara:strand:+ start:217 stop:480 length:264 start_codon:yes stop_codon:yes gene_type:complete